MGPMPNALPPPASLYEMHTPPPVMEPLLKPDDLLVAIKTNHKFFCYVF